MPGYGSGAVVFPWSSPRSQHHAAVARKIHLTHLFRFPEPALTALALCAAWLLCAAFIHQPLHVRKWSFKFPLFRLALGQIVVGSVNFALVAACLHQAIRAFAEASYPSVATAYVLANAASLISHVPGGLGIIESVIVYLVPGANLIAALIVFRAAYFFIPFVFGLATIAITELYWRARGAKI